MVNSTKYMNNFIIVGNDHGPIRLMADKTLFLSGCWVCTSVANELSDLFRHEDFVGFKIVAAFVRFAFAFCTN